MRTVSLSHQAYALATAAMALAAGAQAATTTSAAAGSLGTLVVLKVLLALGLVLAAIVAVALLLRRIGPQQHAASLMRVVGSIAIGPRERLVVVEIEETWFVLGVGPGHITTVHTLPKRADAIGMVNHPAPGWLQRVLEKSKR